jgi:choline dehydrogenase
LREILKLKLSSDDGSEGFSTPGYMGKTLGSSFDWQEPSVPGEVLTSSDIIVHHGKVVGGSSALNFMVFDRGAPADYNVWESLGNTGWNWSNLLSYFKKVCHPIYLSSKYPPANNPTRAKPLPLPSPPKSPTST